MKFYKVLFIFLLLTSAYAAEKVLTWDDTQPFPFGSDLTPAEKATVTNALRADGSVAAYGDINFGNKKATNIVELQVTGGSPTNGAVWIATNILGQGKWSSPSAFCGLLTNNNFKISNDVERTINFTDDIGKINKNIGNNFNGTNFTCPVNGLYSFTFLSYGSPMSGQVFLYLLANGATNVWTQFSDSPTANQEVGSISVNQHYFAAGTVVSISLKGTAGTTNALYGQVTAELLTFFEGGLDRELP